jgi:tRNA (cmo5U34)-methyltransferase
LRPRALLVHADLAFDLASPAFEKLFEVWIRKMTNGAALPDAARNTRAVYGRDVAVLPPAEISQSSQQEDSRRQCRSFKIC